MAIPNDMLKKALLLSPIERAELVDQLLLSLDHPDRNLDVLWAKESENRLDAYEAGKLKAIALEQVLEKYK